MQTISGLQAIQSLNLENVELQLLKAKWSSKRVGAAIAKYKAFLAFRLEHSEADPKPECDVDEVWHRHILHTRQYEQDCLNIFGHHLHHTPELLPATWWAPTAQGPLPQSFLAKLFGFAPQFATCGSGGSQGS